MFTIETGQHNPILRTPGKPVVDFDSALLTMAEEMYRTMIDSEGVGLAAPQIGRSLRLFITTQENMSDDLCESAKLNDKVIAITNPLLLNKQGEEEIMVEGCLSLPDILVEVARPPTITIQGQTLNGERFTTTLSGYGSRILQHEMDHLDGILIIDKGKIVDSNATPAI